MEEILIITRNHPPLVGGMERLMGHAVQELSRQYACTLIGPKGCESFISPPIIGRGCQTTPLPLFLLQAMFRTLTFTSGRKYRFALAGSGLTAPMAGMAKLLHRIPAVSFVHGLDLIAENKVYQKFFVPWLRRMDIVIANSRNTARLAVSKGVKPDKIRILHPGVRFPPEYSGKEDDFRARHNLAGKQILLSVGRQVPRKGIAEFLERSFPRIVAAHPDTVLIIIGTEAKDALKKTGGPCRGLEGIAAAKGLERNLLIMGRVDDAILSAAYRTADLFIFPVRDTAGDVEGFGMVAVEAAAHGLPVVAFASGGVPDAVEDNYSGFLVEKDAYERFAEITVKYLSGKVMQVNRVNCLEFAKRFEWCVFGSKLLEICSSIRKD